MSYNLRRRSKTDKVVEDAETSVNEDFSASESEWSSTSSSSEESTEDSESDENTSPTRSTSKEINVKLNKKKSHEDKAYVINSEDYFSYIKHKKTQISKNSLDKLENARLEQDQLHKFLDEFESTSNHKEARNELLEMSKSQYSRWIFLFQEGYNIILYGLGSKLEVVQDFQKEFLYDYPIVIVNGFFPSLTIKSILDGILEALEMKDTSGSLYDTCDLIQQKMSKNDNFRLYLIINNLDGPLLRASKNQSVLAKLAAIKNLHLLATIDHINAPLIWDNSKLSQFNFIWFNTTTFRPYISETSFESSMIVQRFKSLALSSINNVFISLTSNTKGIYLAIVKYQLEHGAKPHYQGLLFKDLYWTCREAFLVSSDLALRSQLTEFVDHKMLKFRRSADGSEHVIIPMAMPVLKQFVEEQDK